MNTNKKFFFNKYFKLATTVIAILILSILIGKWEATLFSFCSLLLCVLCACFILLSREEDVFCSATISMLLYGCSFSLIPIFLVWKGIFWHSYLIIGFNDLLGNASFLCLVCFFTIIIGYWLAAGRLSAIEKEEQSMPRNHKAFTLVAAIVIGLLGSFSYFGLVLKKGGLSYFLNYTGGRADIFHGIYGGWFWGTLLLFASYGLFIVILMRKHPWLCLGAALLLAAMFFPFQGRDLVVAPFFCWLLGYHYFRKLLGWREICAIGTILVVLSAFVAVYRISDRQHRIDSYSEVLSKFSQSLGKHLIDVLAANIEQLDTVMIAVRYIENNGRELGVGALFNWIEPIDRRIFGDVIPTANAGKFMDELIYPEHKFWNTALSPSLPGELYISVGWSGVAGGGLLYGMLLGLLSRWKRKRDSMPILFAAYPFVTYMIIKMLVDGTSQLFRPIVVLGPILLCQLFAPMAYRKRDSEK